MSFNNYYSFGAGNRSKPKVVVIMGPTGSGKSRLSIDLAIRFSGEIINSDKIQVYKGLNIASNKIPLDEQLGVPHHLLGVVDSVRHGEYTPTEFRTHASLLIQEITDRGKVPFVVGGSNSFIYALLAEDYSPDDPDVFTWGSSKRVSTRLRYDCCFLSIDVSFPVLEEYLRIRVQEMCDSGLVNELASYYDTEVPGSVPGTALMKCIGVPEFEDYLTSDTLSQCGDDDYYYYNYNNFKKAVKAMEDNTCDLAKKQLAKIKRLREGGWGLHRLDGTDAFTAVLEGCKSWNDVWEKDVVEPSVMLVKHFLLG